jgi:hypothetical protein
MFFNASNKHSIDVTAFLQLKSIEVRKPAWEWIKQ